MYNLQDLKDRFSWSYMQARNRVKWLQDSFSEEVKAGKNQKLLVTENGFSILDRLHQLEEKDKLALSTAKNQIKAELENNRSEDSSQKANSKDEIQSNTVKSDANHPGSGSQSSEKYVRQLEKENKFLHNELEQKNRQIQQLLPAAKEEEKDQFKEMGFFQLVKKWLNTKT